MTAAIHAFVPAEQPFTPDDLRALRLCNPIHARARIRELAGIAAKEAGITATRVLSPCRRAVTVTVRDVVMLTCSAEGMPDEVIAAALGMERSCVSDARQRKARRLTRA